MNAPLESISSEALVKLQCNEVNENGESQTSKLLNYSIRKGILRERANLSSINK